MGGLYKLLDTYQTQKNYFETAYRAGVHGWPTSDPSPFVVRFLEQFQQKRSSGTVLDIGCGEGRHTTLFASAGYQTVGLDYQPLALKRAMKIFPYNGLNRHFLQGDVFHLPFLKNKFDILIDYGCLHHVRKRDTTAYLESVVPLLKSGGYFLLSCFSTAFKHHPDEKRQRDWLVHKGHYDRFFTESSFQAIFGKTFDVLQVEEEKEGLDAFFHVVMKKR